jgi:hypothetical protein
MTLDRAAERFQKAKEKHRSEKEHAIMLEHVSVACLCAPQEKHVSPPNPGGLYIHEEMPVCRIALLCLPAACTGFVL